MAIPKETQVTHLLQINKYKNMTTICFNMAHQYSNSKRQMN